MSIKSFIRKEKFYHYFQPIYDLGDWQRKGYEVLLRSDIHSDPEVTFQEAKKVKKLYELDSRSIHKAIHTYDEAGLSKKEELLFLNIFPSTILNQNFPSFLNKIMSDNYVNSQQIVLEISESEIIDEFELFKIRIAELKKQGFFIAIDDVGRGYSDVKSIVELEPDYLKLDRYFSEDLSSSKPKQSFISFFLNYCKQEEIQLVLEGLECEKDLAIAKGLGVHLGQGYILGKPALLKEKL